MTVKELINILNDCDQSAEIKVTFCYVKSKVIPGACVSLEGGKPMVIRDPGKNAVEIYGTND